MNPTSPVEPVRIQRRRTRGYDMQAASRAVNGLPCISVTRPGRWGNPYDMRVFGRELSMALFRETMDGGWNPSILEGQSNAIRDAAYEAHHSFLKRIGSHPANAARNELRGSNLACYCQPDGACQSERRKCSVQITVVMPPSEVYVAN